MRQNVWRQAACPRVNAVTSVFLSVKWRELITPTSSIVVLNEKNFMKQLAQFLAHGKHSMHVFCVIQKYSIH